MRINGENVWLNQQLQTLRSVGKRYRLVARQVLERMLALSVMEVDAVLCFIENVIREWLSEN